MGQALLVALGRDLNRTIRQALQFIFSQSIGVFGLAKIMIIRLRLEPPPLNRSQPA
jgi:hypothetical protein